MTFVVNEEHGATGEQQLGQTGPVVEPDLLWIESVTERLLGSAGRPAPWERVYFEERGPASPATPDPAQGPDAVGSVSPASRAAPFDAPQPAAVPQPSGPPADALVVPPPYTPAPSPGGGAARGYAPQVDITGRDSGPPARGQADPRASPPAPPTGAAGAGRDDTPGWHAAARAAQSTGGSPRPLPPDETAGQHDYVRPKAPGMPVGAAALGDRALRLAFVSGDTALADAVVRLVAQCGVEQQRLVLLENYLDALLAQGGEALPGAARLRRLLRE